MKLQMQWNPSILQVLKPSKTYITQCATPAGIVTMGWKSMSAMMDILRLSYMWRILLLPLTDIDKSLLIYMIYSIYHSKSQNTGPTASIVRACIKYNLMETVLLSIETGQYMSKRHWKKLITSTIMDFDKKRQKITCTLYKSLNRLHRDNSMSSWWKVVHNDPELFRKCNVIIRLLVFPGKSEGTICNKCNSLQQNYYEHIMFQCMHSKTERIIMWNKFTQSCPPKLAQDIESMNISEKTNFLLNCMNNTYVKEWHNIYKLLAEFLYWIWEANIK